VLSIWDVDALVELGLRKYTATRQGQQFIKYDEITTRKLAEKRHDKMAYMITVGRNSCKSNYLKDVYSQVQQYSWDSQHLKTTADVSESTES
jgi:CPA2 family monovalent cation:H+ antiporter-2